MRKALKGPRVLVDALADVSMLADAIKADSALFSQEKLKEELKESAEKLAEGAEAIAHGDIAKGATNLAKAAKMTKKKPKKAGRKNASRCASQRPPLPGFMWMQPPHSSLQRALNLCRVRRALQVERGRGISQEHRFG